ncbi:class I SAM-dependent methyltransferase [Mesorhizobium sp.]|uniref:class I SAM-dependent methyltransferase n=1 Tax=Mesorhizobium sp. TaxID=1871066 RepID=UPI00257EF4C9|nr:class I SAM-dependent methyltransferase [Mesorhizobium sp.]
MAEAARHDAWQAGDSYDLYMGRWSRQIAPLFLDWLDPAEGLDWLEVGCGTGALSAAILARCNPSSLVSIDPSEGFLAKARANVPDERVEFLAGDAQALSVKSGSKDMVVSALVLNFIADKQKALAEMRRVARPGATIGFYVWDYPPAAGWNSCGPSGPLRPRLTPAPSTLPKTGVFHFAHKMD